MLTKFLRSASGNASAPTQVSYITNVLQDSGASSYTFTNTNIGGAGLIVVVIHGERGTGSYSVSSCTIGGVSATIHLNPSVETSCAIVSAVITSGSTATISVTFDQTLSRCAIGVYRVTGYVSTTPVATGTQTVTSGTSLSTTLNTSANGIVIAGVTSSTTNSGFTWTNITENYEVRSSTILTSLSGASSTTTGGNLTVSTTASLSVGEFAVLSAVSWR
jgi:hypothetical protein